MRALYVFSLFLMFAAALPASALEETEYFAVFMEGKKIGHVIGSRIIADGKVTNIGKVSTQVSRANTPDKMNTTTTYIETTDGKLLGFEIVQDFGISGTMNTSGTVNEQGVVNMTVTSMGKTQKTTFEWPSDALTPEGFHSLQLKKGFKEGLEYIAKLFSPPLGPGNIPTLEIKIRIGAKRNVYLLGRVAALTEVKTTFKTQGSDGVVSTSYVDENFRTQKSVGHVMGTIGTQSEMFSCTKEFALKENDVPDLVDGKMLLASPEPLSPKISIPDWLLFILTQEAFYISGDRMIVYPTVTLAGFEINTPPGTPNDKAMTVTFMRGGKIIYWKGIGEIRNLSTGERISFPPPRSWGPLNRIESAESITYHLSPSVQATMLAIPSTDNQSVQQLREGGAIVTVRPIAVPEGAKFPYEGKDSNILKAMKPTKLVQSDRKEIIELANRAVGGTRDAAEAAKRIESFAAEYIKVGDCGEFAVLTASMCRAVGIPARIVSGLVYRVFFTSSRRDVFVGHTWVEAYVGDKWIGLDAMTKDSSWTWMESGTAIPRGFDASHIALAMGDGEPADFFDLASTFGQFKIGRVTINTQKIQD